MLYALFYILIGVIVHFFMYKKYWNDLQDNMRKVDIWLESKEGWLICIAPIFWVIALPLMVLWYVLEKIYSQLNKQNNNEKHL